MSMARSELRRWVKQMIEKYGNVSFAKGPLDPRAKRHTIFSFVISKQRYYAFKTAPQRNRFVREYPGSSPCENPLNN